MPSSTQAFLPGCELSRRFYWEAVRPLLDLHFPGLPHAAALIGPGSEVLGFDSELSMDHDWFPRVQLFLREEDTGLEAGIRQMLAGGLPHQFLGFPVDWVSYAPEPETRIMAARDEGPVQHGVVALTLRAACRQWLAWEPDRPPEPADWLTFPSQVLRSVTAGAVHHDGVGRADRLSPADGMVPARRVALSAGCGLEAHRAGGAPDAARGVCRRRSGLGGHWGAAGAGLHEPRAS